MKDVARAAGVSIASVSYALNGSPKVSEETRSRILKIAGDMGFQPDGLARKLRTRKSGMIGIFSDGLSSAYFNEIAQGVQDALWSSGYGLVVAGIPPQLSRQGFRLLEERWVDGGIILSPNALPLSGISRVARTIPLVLVDSRPVDSGEESADKEGAGTGDTVLPMPDMSRFDGPGAPSESSRICRLKVENVESTREIASLLCSPGRTRIGFMGGPESSWDSRERYEVLSMVLREKGLPVLPELKLDGQFWRQGARTALDAFLDQRKRADAWFCANDEMAVGVIQSLAAHGLSVPGDVAVTGFDDIELASLFSPGLTTVSYDRHALGVTAMEMLTDMLENRPVPETVTIPTQVIRRHSA